MTQGVDNQHAIDSHQLLRSLGEGVYGIDPEGRTTFLNPTAERLLGWTFLEIAGKVQHGIVHHSHPDGRPYSADDCPVHSVLRTGTAVRVAEDVFWTKDNRPVPVEYIATPVFQDNRVAGAVVAFRDISEEQASRREIALHQEMLHEALTIARLGSWEWEPGTDRVTWSDDTYRIFGLELGTTIDLATYHARIHPDDRPRLEAAVRAAVERGESYSLRHRVVRPDGSECLVSSHGRAVRDAQGDIVRVRGVVQDITDITLAETKALAYDDEQAAREQADRERARLQRILREAPAMICVTAGPEHRIEILNRRFEDSIGSRYIIGLPIREAFQETSVGDLFFDLMDEVYASGEPYLGYQARSMRDDDGDGFPEAEVYSDFVIQPIYGRAGVEGILLHAVDVTSQVLAERAIRRHAEALEEGEARLRLALEAGHMGTWEWALDENRIVFSAPLERIHGLKAGAFAGTPAAFEQLIHPDDRKRAMSRIRRAISRGSSLQTEYRIVRPGGTVRWLETRGTIIRDGFGRATRLTGVAIDVTERREGEDALKRSLASLQRLTRALERNNRELDQFAYVASHDLKAPLRGIANLSQWIEEEIGGALTDQAREYMDLLRGRIHRMEGLIEGILSYSRVGRTSHGIEDVDTGALAREVIELLAPPDDATVTIVGDMPRLRTERLPLQQVLLNLIGNALKYAGAGARVTVSSADADVPGYVTFAVADNGPGIAPEYHEKVWGIFQTLQPRDKVEGTGIGLALVRKIVEHRGGRAWIESSPGQGATFAFLWPIHEDSHD